MKTIISCKKYIINILAIILIFFLVQQYLTSSDEFIRKKRAVACSKLLKLRIQSDQEYFRQIIQSTTGPESEKNDEATNKLVSILILDCYNTINEDRANNALNDFKAKTIEVKEYKDLINLEKWDELFQSEERNKVNEEMDSLKFAMAEMKEIELTKETEKEVMGELFMDGEEKEQIKRGAKIEKNKIDMTIFGFNFNKLSTGMKYFISFLLIAVIFMGMAYGLNYIKSLDRKVKSKSKKEKKN